MSKSTSSYPVVTLLQYIGAILVVLLHCKRVFAHDGLHFIQKSLFSRMVVPYFMTTSAYFIRQRWQTKGFHLWDYCRRHLPRYLAWSCFYSPFALYYYCQSGFEVKWLPLALAVGLLYTGLSYHLWYVPAFLTALMLVSWLWQKRGGVCTIVLALCLYLLGAVETYSAYLSQTGLGQVFRLYQTYFLTTRNGLFYAPIFVALGFWLYDRRQCIRLTSRFYLGWLFTVILVMLEGWLIYRHQGVDKNFVLSLVPWTGYLLAWSLKTTWLQGKVLTHLRSWSSWYYFSHVFLVEACFLLLPRLSLTGYILNRWVFVLSLGVTHGLGLVWFRWGQPCVKSFKVRKEMKGDW